MNIKNNTTSLQDLLAQAQALPEALDTSDATATASSILSGDTAYANGEKITGTIETKTSSDLTASGATVSVPAGYYSAQASKSVATATQATPTVSIDSAGKITATSTQEAGYVLAGTKTGTTQLTTQAAKTVTPTKSEQTAVASGVYTTGAIKVAAIPSEYADVSGVTASVAHVVAGDVFVDADGETQTGRLNTESVILLSSEFGNAYLDAELVDFTTDSYLRIDGDEFGNAIESQVLSGKTFTSGKALSFSATGTMPNNGDTSATIDGLETKTVSIPLGYTSGGTVAVDDTVDNIADEQADLLSQIQTALEGKAGGGGTALETCTVKIGNDANSDNGTDFYEIVYMGLDTSLKPIYKHEQISNNAITVTALTNSSMVVKTSMPLTTFGSREELSELSSLRGYSEDEYTTRIYAITAPADGTASLYAIAKITSGGSAE